ncbi:hypothetical protein DERP_003950 [Dermatophagoides pteronyssinus]|uniref:Uncharacterized protein n=1 Tax=Dermatophagoides pteronyssinus TaxID=6956 RepID=A0ABQ8J7S4_DERPT|nr:hypothetical protein DERP_003950 [Dermatophagoides pteronyssinus]
MRNIDSIEHQNTISILSNLFIIEKEKHNSSVKRILKKRKVFQSEKMNMYCITPNTTQSTNNVRVWCRFLFLLFLMLNNNKKTFVNLKHISYVQRLAIRIISCFGDKLSFTRSSIILNVKSSKNLADLRSTGSKSKNLPKEGNTMQIIMLNVKSTFIIRKACFTNG